jgi:hypothetical protein
MFVDDDWNIVGLIDFEFAPVQPIQTVGVPIWLSGFDISELTGPELDEYKAVHDQFLEILAEEESTRQQDHRFSEQLRHGLRTGQIWYAAGLQNLNGFPTAFQHLIAPKFLGELHGDHCTTLVQLWDEQVEDFIAQKVAHKERYDQRIRDIFAVARAAGGAAQSESADERKEEASSSGEVGTETVNG